jgi:hypothetical protein
LRTANGLPTFLRAAKVVKLHAYAGEDMSRIGQKQSNAELFVMQIISFGHTVGTIS